MPLGLQIDIEARFAQFADSLDKIQRQAQQTANRLQTAFSGVKGVLGTLGVGVSVAGFASMIKSAIDAQDHINDLSKATGISVERLAGLSLAARQSGSDLDSIAASTAKLSVNIGKEGDKFKALGVTAKDPLVAFEQLADVFTSLQDPEQRAAVAAAALGKQWQGAAPLLAEGGKRIKEIVEQGSKLSGITKENADEADKFNDQLAILKTQSSATATKLANDLLPALNSIVQAFSDGYREGGLFIGTLEALRSASSGFIEGVAKNVSGIKLDSVTKQIDALQTQLDSGHSTNSPILKFLGFDFNLSAKGIQNVKNKIAELQVEQKALLNELDPPKANATIEGPQSDAAKQSAAREAARKKAEADAAAARAKNFLAFAQNQADAKAAAEARLKLIESQNKIEIDAQKQAASDETNILEKRHADNLVGEQDYWNGRAEIRKAGLAAELAAIDKTIAARAQAVASPPAGAKEADRINNQRELVEAQAKRAQIVAAGAQSDKVALLDQAEAEKHYLEQVQAATIAVQELKGETAAAAAARFDLSNKSLSEQADVNHDEALKKIIADQRALTVAQAEYNELQTKLEAIYARLADEEERIQNQVRLHAITELESLRQTSVARQKAADEAAAIVQRQEEIAKGEGGTDPLKLKAEQARVALETLAAQSDLVGEKIRTELTDSFSGLFDDLISHTKSFKDAFLDFLNSIERKITNLISQQLGDQLFKSILPKGGGSGGPGDFLSKLFGIGGSSETPGAPLPSTGDTNFSFDSITANIPAFASGTNYVPFDMVAQIHKGERIVPASQNHGGGGMPAVVNHFNISGPIDTRSQSQIAAAAYSGAQRAWRRNG